MVKASFFCEIAMVTRGFETRLQILSSNVLWYVAMVAITSAILYGAGISRYYIWGQDGRVVKASFSVRTAGGITVVYLCGF